MSVSRSTSTGGHSRLVVAMAVAASCGGAACSSGLSYKIEDSAMDTVPANERTSVFDARRDLEVAQGERRTAETQLEGLDHDRDIADKEKQQAQLEVEKANAEFEASVQAHDQNRNEAAAHGKDVAELGLKVAEAKLDWIVQKKAWYKANRTAADAHVAAAEAKVELEKARVAKTKGIKTADEVDVGKFESQSKDRSSDWQSAKKDAESEQKSAQKLEEKWKDLVSQHAKSRGG
jgi:hypothetical protein